MWTLVKIAKGAMTQVSQLQERTLYTVRNQGDAPSNMVIEHPARSGWTLAKAPGNRKRRHGNYRFRPGGSGKSNASLPSEEVQALNTTYQIADLEPRQIEVFLRARPITSEMAGRPGENHRAKRRCSCSEQEMENRQKDIDRIVKTRGALCART